MTSHYIGILKAGAVDDNNDYANEENDSDEEEDY